MHKIKISIVIPVYNVAPYVEDCLKSVMRQTFTDELECLIVNDCSTDDSVTIIQRMLSDYDGPIRFQLIHHDHNRGLSATRNSGTLQATGDYIYYLDSDDMITDDCIEKLAAIVSQDPTVELVQGRHKRSNSCSKGKKAVLIRTSTNDEVRTCKLAPYSWNKLIKHSLILDHQLFFKEGILYEDLLWIFLLRKHVSRAVIIPDITYTYRIRPHSITTSITKKTRAFYKNIVFMEVSRNLTPGYEAQELMRYSRSFGMLYVRYVHAIPEFRETLRSYRKLTQQYNCRKNLLELTLFSLAGKFKYGWVPFYIQPRLKRKFRNFKRK